MLVRALGSSPAQGEGADWFIPYVSAASAMGLTREGDLYPLNWNDPMQRREMARAAVRGAGIEAASALEHPAMKEQIVPFLQSRGGGASLEAFEFDEPTVLEYVLAAVEHGLLHGYGGGELALEDAVTRAQAVTIIERILAHQEGNRPEADPAAVQTALQFGLFVDERLSRVLFPADTFQEHAFAKALVQALHAEAVPFGMDGDVLVFPLSHFSSRSTAANFRILLSAPEDDQVLLRFAFRFPMQWDETGTDYLNIWASPLRMTVGKDAASAILEFLKEDRAAPFEFNREVDDLKVTLTQTEASPYTQVIITSRGE